MLPTTPSPEPLTTQPDAQDQCQPRRRPGKPPGAKLKQPSKPVLREHIARVAQHNAEVAALLVEARRCLHEAVETASQLSDGEQARTIATAARQLKIALSRLHATTPPTDWKLPRVPTDEQEQLY